MHKESSSLLVQYGAALLAAPLFCLIYVGIFQQGTEDMYWLLNDGRSFFFLVFFYPLIEELAFRGLIQEYITKKTGQRSFFLSLSVPNLLTSILFVLMHFIHHEPVWALLVIFPSFVFGYFKEKFDRIVPSIILHMFYNLSFFSFIGN